MTASNENGLSSNETIFQYYQRGTVITGNYAGGAIQEGFLIGKLSGEVTIELLYQCITTAGELKAGRSVGTISVTPHGKLQLDFDWNWLTGDRSGGKSVYIELK